MNFFGPNGSNPNSLLNQLAQGAFAQGQQARPPPSAYNEYFKAYSVAMLPGRPRDNVSYGGKIIMPPSALAQLTNLDLESPWMFKLRNPANAAASTHAGVLEFIADEGTVCLPYWMMKTLRLEEGDPIRITGAELPKGKFTKLQAQSVHFLEISDPKAVLEQAMRNFSTLTQGDIIEISYNSIVFGLLVMETKPGGEGIGCHDTDLEVDFAAPVGYVEPERPKPAAPATMASKLNIDLNQQSPGSSRPGSSIGGGFAGSTAGGGTAVSKDGDSWETFKGRGETLSGRKTKGKGVSHRKVEQIAEGSKIIRTENRRIVTNDTLGGDIKVPAALNLPFGKMFFGFAVTPYVEPESAQDSDEPSSQEPASFGGSGNTLTGRSLGQPSASSSKGKGKAKETDEKPSHAYTGTGNTLGNSVPRSLGPVGAGGAAIPRLPQRESSSQKKKARSPSPVSDDEHDWGVDTDDEDVIMIDSD